MSDDIIVAIIGGIMSIIAAAIVPILEKRLEKKGKGKKGKKQSASKGGGKRFRVSIFWFIPVGIAFLTLIIFLGVQHEARQNFKKILYDSPEFHGNVAKQLADMGDFAGAALEYSQIIEDDNSDAFAHDQYAYALMKQGKLEEALKENVAACALAPDVAQYHNNKGVTLYEMGGRKLKEGNEKAEQQYRKNSAEACKTAIDLDSKVADYHYNFSRALLSISDTMGELDNAILECMTALRLNPNKSEYHTLYSFLLYGREQFENALDEARTAVKLAPDDDFAHYTLAWNLQQTNQLDEAIPEYREAIRLNSDNGDYYCFLGDTLYYLGRYREALKEYQIGINLIPTSASYQQSITCYNAADTLIALNRYEEALQYVEGGIEAYPDLPESHYLRFALLTYFNRHEEAKQELQTAYELGGIPLPEEYT